jgi:hypothetical protein
MARKLTKLKITEVSSCDRAANPGARIVTPSPAGA